ncbi:WxL protein peptidoglycan domain-containing protein [Streptomyces sp. NPDC058953]|uniref:WxL protein peptidoglycan domain-containing protein n=1 Tax=unclassified Streptomyces TaxID=2593676 RepID=UPI0036945FA6
MIRLSPFPSPSPSPSPSRAARRRVLPPGVLAAALALVLLPAPGPARAAENAEWSVYPVASVPGGRPYFHLAAAPGTTAGDRVTLTNKTAAPLTFRLYAADAYNTERDGGFAVRAVTERQRGIGAWARPARERVTVPARGSVTVPYTLTVPEDAEPGDHAGALVALDERISRSGGPVDIGVRRAVGARIHLRVEGPAVPALSVEDLRLAHHRPLLPGTGDSTAVISYTLHNRGNVTLNPRVELAAEGLFGRDLLARRLTAVPAELLPRQKVRLTERWRGAPHTEWGEVRLTATAQGVRESAGVSYVALPWVAALVLAVLGGGAGVWLRVRRRAGHAGDTA